MPKVTLDGNSIYHDRTKVGEIDHDNVVFLVDRKYEADVRTALRNRFGEHEVEFVY